MRDKKVRSEDTRLHLSRLSVTTMFSSRSIDVFYNKLQYVSVYDMESYIDCPTDAVSILFRRD